MTILLHCCCKATAASFGQAPTCYCSMNSRAWATLARHTQCRSHDFTTKHCDAPSTKRCVDPGAPGSGYCVTSHRHRFVPPQTGFSRPGLGEETGQQELPTQM